MGSPKRFVRQDDGSVAIEYVLIASVVSVAIIATVPQFAPSINSIFAMVVAGLDLN
jgi:Flp pilus assembly pilin Flp